MEKILVSACLLGLAVRYDGASKSLVNTVLKLWRQQGRLVTVCPEVAGGLAIPRAPAEIQVSDSPQSIADNKVIETVDGQDVSAAFYRGAKHALYLCQQHHIRYALLKEFSPSCGSNQVYSGDFNNQKVAGQGITSALLSIHGVEVFSD